MHYFDVTDLFATCKTALEVMLRDVVLWEAQPWSVEAQSEHRAWHWAWRFGLIIEQRGIKAPMAQSGFGSRIRCAFCCISNCT